MDTFEPDEQKEEVPKLTRLRIFRLRVSFCQLKVNFAKFAISGKRSERGLSLPRRYVPDWIPWSKRHVFEFFG